MALTQDWTPDYAGADVNKYFHKFCIRMCGFDKVSVCTICCASDKSSHVAGSDKINLQEHPGNKLDRAGGY